MTFETIYFTFLGIIGLVLFLKVSLWLLRKFLERHPDSEQPVIKALATAYWPLHEGWVLGGIQDHHRKAGHPDPWGAAHQEVYLRGEYIEKFRDLATDAYLRDGTDLETVKKDFIRDNLSTKTTILDTATTGSVRAVIRDMPINEAYHPEAYAKWKADIEKWSRDVMAEAERTLGPGGYTPHQRRVLRGLS